MEPSDYIEVKSSQLNIYRKIPFYYETVGGGFPLADLGREMGYEKIQTYILDRETGASLLAAGWEFDGNTAGCPWKHTSGPRNNNHPTCDKGRWIKTLQNKFRHRPTFPNTVQLPTPGGIKTLELFREERGTEDEP